MSNYVSFRIAKGSVVGIRNQLNHDYREGHVPKYINKDKTSDNIFLIDRLRANTVKTKIAASKTLVKEKTGRKSQDNAEFMFKGIMSFSPNMKKDYANNKELFEENSKKFLKTIEDKYDMVCLSAVIHLDETTPHIHLIFDNISKISGKGIRRKISPSKLSNMQTILGNCFDNMGYKRGKAKEETLAEHIDFKDFHKVKLMVEKLNLKQDLIIKTIKAYKAGNIGIVNYVNYFDKNSGDMLKDSNKVKALKAIKDL